MTNSNKKNTEMQSIKFTHLNDSHYGRDKESTTMKIKALNCNAEFLEVEMKDQTTKEECEIYLRKVEAEELYQFLHKALSKG